MKRLRYTSLGFPLHKDGSPVVWTVDDWKDFYLTLTSFARRVCARAGRAPDPRYSAEAESPASASQAQSE